ncbi:MAG TPA: flagellar protein FlgN [Pirellulaceae bacterium]|jgi:flagellar biosynthesis/type III secretory pathway chaperone
MDFEAEITGLLDDLTSVQSELLEVLAQKRVALTNADMQALAELQPREVELSNRLAACQDRRSSLLEEAKRQGRPSENVARLANSTSGGKPNKLGTQVKETAARMRILQHHSLANWVLAQRSLLHVSQLLEIIATGGQMRPTYGDRESVYARGSLVNQQA